MLRLYSLTLGLSALLMFSVQPIISKILLPVLGGNPSVWNAAVMFFQVTLLFGYAYVHVGRELLGPRKQALLHIVVLLFSLLFLPLAVSQNALTAEAHDAPIAWLLGVLLVTLGVPFFAISANVPLLSSWFAAREKNPYMLYAASNLGSLIGLLSYPLVIEPFFSLSTQRILWSAGYGLLAALVGYLLKNYLAQPEKKKKKEKKRAEKSAPLTRRLLWVLLAFVPSSLMLSVTSHITTDIAPIPLLWVVPLALYLLSFVFVFAEKPIGITWSRRLFIPIALPLALMLGLMQEVLPYWPWFFAGIIYLAMTLVLHPKLHLGPMKNVYIPIIETMFFFAPMVLLFSGRVHYMELCAWYLAVFFLVAMVCHGRLSELKPKPELLTEFYFFLSLGGALGGVFNVLIAPLLFNTLVELPLVLGLSFFLLPSRKEDWKNSAPMAVATVTMLASLLLYTQEYRDLGWFDHDIIEPFNQWMWNLHFNVGNLGFAEKPDTFAFIEIVLPMVVAFFLRRNVPALSILVMLALMVGICKPNSARDVRFQGRNFFGTLDVVFVKARMTMYLSNGTTQHGAQYRDQDHALTPTSYYKWEGPLGAMVQAMRARPEGAGMQVAAVGLGAGTVACLAEEGQTTTFFEINPMVEMLAHRPELFSYLRDCPGSNRVVMGDARLSLKQQPDHFYSLIILDAFNSDAVPIHLLTHEALSLYLDKLAPHGVIAYHISNRHLQLLPVIGNLAAEKNLAGIWGDFADSTWVFVARAESDLGSAGSDLRFHLLAQNPAQRIWTDDYSDIISVLR